MLGYGYRVKARLTSLQSLPRRVRNLALVYYWDRIGTVGLSRWVKMRAAVLALIENTKVTPIPVTRVIDAILERVEAKLHRYVDSVYLTPILAQRSEPKGKSKDVSFPPIGKDLF